MSKCDSNANHTAIALRWSGEHVNTRARTRTRTITNMRLNHNKDAVTIKAAAATTATSEDHLHDIDSVSNNRISQQCTHFHCAGFFPHTCDGYIF